MKIKYIFPIFFAALALMTSCNEEQSITLLDEIQVSSSYVSIPVAGGSTSITVTAKDSWTAEKVTTDKNKVEWLTISSASGNAGEATLTFTAPAAIDGRNAEVLIKSGGKTQRVNIIQGLSKISPAKVSEVNAGPDGKTFQVTGVCTSIVNTDYGNWYLKDNTGSLYIYGTLDAKGATRNFKSLNLEVGDEVTVEGPKSTYQGTAQLVNVMVIKINKSLVKVDSVKNASLPIEGGEFTAYLTCKGQGVSVDIPTDAQSWLAISSIKSAGTKTVVKFKAAANTGGDRNTKLIFKTTDGKKDYTTETSLSQKGAIVKATIAEFLAAAVGDTQYRLSGIITKIDNNTDGRLYIRDFSGETYVYKIQDFATKGLKVSDIITIVGKRAAYNGVAQVGGAVLESVIPVTSVTIAEFLTKADDPNKYYMVSGNITNIATGNYGNLDISDGTNTLYVYGCYPGYGATGTARQGLITSKGIKVGDKLTVIGPKGSYNSVPQVNGGLYFSHESSN
ncbi:MAG: DNA-binding protein [Bacteroidia bacterium]|nr:DNA-binding protein [Bacteroidia bacterium]